MSASMVDVVALAITDCDAAGPIGWSAATVVARAAIEAMREPTEAMIDAADRAMNMGPGPDGGMDHNPRVEWQAMIDKALSQ